MGNIEIATAQVKRIVKAYNTELDKGKRAVEAEGFAERHIEELDAILRGNSRGIMGLVDTMAGYREVPAKDTDREQPIREMSKELWILKQRAQELIEKDPCKHTWVPQTYFRGGFTPPSVDFQCKHCESFVTFYDSSLYLLGEYVPDEELRQRFKEIVADPDKERKSRKAYEFWKDTCKHLELPQTNETWNLAHSIK